MIVDLAVNNSDSAAAPTNTIFGAKSKKESLTVRELNKSVTEIMSQHKKSVTESPDPDNSPFLEEWGFTLKQLYNLAVSFFRG